MFEFDLLSLRQPESASDIGEWLARENDRSWTNGPDSTDELNIFNCFGEELQPAAILFEKSQARAIDLAINEKTYQAFMTKAGSKRELPLGNVEGRFGITQAAIVETRDVLEGRIPHGGVISIDV
jgi:hypothetical protein